MRRSLTFARPASRARPISSAPLPPLAPRLQLRFAFQNDEKLYLVTDYYAGGSLFYHLRKSRGFAEPRARMYSAELLLALAHLHEHGIIYRDLKLENVLMDHHGHIALTDFGLSKENLENVQDAQLTTFCGTAECVFSRGARSRSRARALAPRWPRHR
jgi:serine/threonine protein kinase